MNSTRKATIYSVIPFLVVPLILSAVQIVASFSATSPAQMAASPRAEATVTRVIDGGTVEVRIGGQTFQVAYAGVELPKPIGMEYARSDVLYAQGSGFNRELMEEQKVTLERDVTNTDSQGRLLRWVWKEGQLVNASIVSNGLAYVNVTPPDSRYSDQLFAALDMARREGVGLWVTDENDCATCKYLQDQAEKAAAAGQ
ncbi:MAG: thermonuclease family protein [Chloroflexi bacterium]|nr:thermonuclease family protein [Chloroflexota bacterium]